MLSIPNTRVLPLAFAIAVENPAGHTQDRDKLEKATCRSLLAVGKISLAGCACTVRQNAEQVSIAHNKQKKS
jgi:hypothetical protein